MSKREDYKRFIVFCLASLVVLAQAAVFAWVWYSVYRGQIDEPFWRKGNWVLIAIYGLMFALFAKLYGGLKVGYLKRIDVFYSLTLALLCTNVVEYLEITLINRWFLSVWPMIEMTGIQLVLIIIWIFGSRYIYSGLYRARRLLVIYGDRDPGDDLIHKMNSRKDKSIVFALDGKLPDEFNKCIPDFLPVHTFKVYVDSIQIVLNRHGNNLVYQILSLRGMGQDFCCIDIFIFQIADKRPDFNPLVMTVIYIIQACQVGNVSIVVIQIKPGRREYIDSSGIGKDRGNRVICRLVCNLMPGHTDIVIFLYMCKGIRSEIAFSCFFFDGGKHTFLHVSNNTVVCHYFVPVVALFDHGDFLFGRNFFQNRAFDASSYAQGGIFFAGCAGECQ